MLLFPVYSLEVFENFVYFGGGGGNEIKNMIKGYRTSWGKTRLYDSQEVFSESTGEDVCNFMVTAKDGLNLMAMCHGKNIVLVKIDPATGKLIKLQSWIADFA